MAFFQPIKPKSPTLISKRFSALARPLRIEYPGAVYHVINRGNAGDDIFNSLRDREKLLAYQQSAIFT